MASRCRICTHSRRKEIDKRLLAREPLRKIAQNYSASTTSLFRHQKHISQMLVRASEAAEVSHAGDLLQQLTALGDEARRLKEKAERDGDCRTALAAVRELCRIIELLAKMRGDLDERSQTNILNVHLDPETAKRVAATYLARHGGHDD